MDEVTAVIEVKLSYVVSVSVGPSNPLCGDQLKKVLLEHVQNRIDAAGGLDLHDIDSHQVIELRVTDTDQLLLQG